MYIGVLCFFMIKNVCVYVCLCVCVCGPFIVLLKADSSMLHPVVVLVESYIYIYVQKEYTKFREIAQLSIGFVYTV